MRTAKRVEYGKGKGPKLIFIAFFRYFILGKKRTNAKSKTDLKRLKRTD